MRIIKHYISHLLSVSQHRQQHVTRHLAVSSSAVRQSPRLLEEVPAVVDLSRPVETARAGVPEVAECGRDPAIPLLLIIPVPASAVALPLLLPLPLARLPVSMSAPQHSALR